MTHDNRSRTLVLDVAASLLAHASARVRSTAASAPQDDDPDRDPNDSQPDFYVATLNTNLRLPKGKMAFRLTHRFLRHDGRRRLRRSRRAASSASIRGAQIGLDLKYGLFRGSTVGIYRTSDRTIQLPGPVQR